MQCSIQVQLHGLFLLDEYDPKGRGKKEYQIGVIQERGLTSNSMIYQGIYSEKGKDYDN